MYTIKAKDMRSELTLYRFSILFLRYDDSLARVMLNYFQLNIPVQK